MNWSGRRPRASTCGSGRADWCRWSTATWRPCRSRSRSTTPRRSPSGPGSAAGCLSPFGSRLPARHGRSPVGPAAGRPRAARRHRGGRRAAASCSPTAPRNSGMTLGVGVEHVVESDAPTRLAPTYGPDEAEATITVDAEAGTSRPHRQVPRLPHLAGAPHQPSSSPAATAPLDRAVRDGFDAHAGRPAEQPRPLLGPSRRGRRVHRRPGSRSSRLSAGTCSSSRRRPGGPRGPASRPRG